MTSGNRDLADRVGHVVDCDAQEALGDFVEGNLGLQRFLDLLCDLLQPGFRRGGIKRLIAIRSEYGGEFARLIRPRNRLQSVTVRGPPPR